MFCYQRSHLEQPFLAYQNDNGFMLETEKLVSPRSPLPAVSFVIYPFPQHRSATESEYS